MGDVLLNNGTMFVNVNYGTVTLSSDANQSPNVATAHVFFTDASALTQNRNITPDPVGAAEREGMTIIVAVVGGTFNYQLTADITINLTSKLVIELTMISGVWTVAQFKPYTGNL